MTDLAPDPNLREWPAPQGVRATPEGIRASFTALGLRSVSDVGPGIPDGSAAPESSAVRFEAWKNPRVTGALFAAALAAGTYLGLRAAGAPEILSIAVVIVEAYYVPMWVLPSYRVRGRIQNGQVSLRLESRGLLARTGRLERRLRFYLADEEKREN